MNKIQYFKRIGINKTDPSVDLATLKLLQKQHLLNVPFENLDIHWKRLIILDTTNFYTKIVLEKRGGFCYELNSLFNELLSLIGFQSRIISARASQGGGKFGPAYDHLAILASVGGEEFLVDVGFGDHTAEPLKFVLNVEQRDENGLFSIRKFDADYFEVIRKAPAGWKSEYIFDTCDRVLAEFAGMCNFHQTSPESHFTKGKICSLMRSDGRVTLTDDKFIETKNGQKIESQVLSEDEFNQILEREFKIETKI